MDLRKIAQIAAATIAALTAFSSVIPIPYIQEIATVAALVLHLKPSAPQ